MLFNDTTIRKYINIHWTVPTGPYFINFDYDAETELNGTAPLSAAENGEAQGH